MAAVRGFAELELGERGAKDLAFAGGPGVAGRGLEVIEETAAEVVAPGESGGEWVHDLYFTIQSSS